MSGDIFSVRLQIVRLRALKFTTRHRSTDDGGHHARKEVARKNRKKPKMRGAPAGVAVGASRVDLGPVFGRNNGLTDSSTVLTDCSSPISVDLLIC